MSWWVIVIAVLIGLVVLAKVIGLIKSIFRMALALLIGVGFPWMMYLVVENVLAMRMDAKFTISPGVYVLIGAVLALSVLFKLRA
jgi:hypothetical protein